MYTLATPGVNAARKLKALGRATLIREVSHAGALAFRELSFTRAMLEVAGRPEGGNVTREDFDEVEAKMLEPVVTGNVVHAADSDMRIDVALDTVSIVVSDPLGVFAAAHCAFDSHGPEIAPHQVLASRLALPVRRGVPRFSPGEPIRLSVPIGLLVTKGVPWAAFGVEDTVPMDWGLVDLHVLPDLTLEQAMGKVLSEGGPGRRVMGVVAGSGGGQPRWISVCS
ncbi:MAG: hypothetical protein FWD57_17005 [Polyangiaceae bacterium]|nr:hypothetical protein [Polyangiaceae bacterium]